MWRGVKCVKVEVWERYLRVFVVPEVKFVVDTDPSAVDLGENVEETFIL